MVNLKSLFLFLLICLFFVIPLSHAATPTATTLVITPSNALAAQQIATLNSHGPISRSARIGWNRRCEFSDHGKLYLGSVQVVRDPVAWLTLWVRRPFGQRSASRTPYALCHLRPHSGLRLQHIHRPGRHGHRIGCRQHRNVFPRGFSRGLGARRGLFHNKDNNGFPDIDYIGFPDARSFVLGEAINHLETGPSEGRSTLCLLLHRRRPSIVVLIIDQGVAPPRSTRTLMVTACWTMPFSPTMITLL